MRRATALAARASLTLDDFVIQTGQFHTTSSVTLARNLLVMAPATSETIVPRTF